MLKEIKELRSKAKSLEPVVRIGKSGITEGTLKEIEKILEKRKLIKIKLLKTSYLDKEKDEFVKDLIMKTRSKLIESVGNVIVIYRP